MKLWSVEDLDERVRRYSASVCEDEHSAQLLDEASSADLVIASGALRDAIHWSWLYWLRSHDFPTIHRGLGYVVRRGIDLVRRRDHRDEWSQRNLHDNRLLQCAVLAGDLELAREAADVVRVAEPGSSQYQYVEAWTGILHARVLGVETPEREQLNAMRRYKPDRIDPWPSWALVQSFVERDYGALVKHVRSGCRKHWHMARKEGAIRTVDDIDVVSLRNRHLHFLWPYVEVVFAKLALVDGAVIEYDDLWFPRQFVTSFASGR